MDVLIETEEGAVSSFQDDGIIALDFLVSTPDIREYSDEVQGRAGSIDGGADYGEKIITVPFLFEAYDLLDFPLKRDRVLSKLGGRKPYFIYEGRNDGNMYAFEKPGEMPFTDEAGNPRAFDPFTDIPYQYVYGKRYWVRRTNKVTIEQEGLLGRGEIEYKVIGIPFGQSAATTQTPLVIGNTGNAMQDSIWTLGGPEIFEDPNKLKYTWGANDTIWIYNGGDVPIDPCQMPLRIEYRGNSTNLRIRNLTNGTEWFRSKPNGSLASDHFVIDGIQSFRNGIDIVDQTNYNLLELDPGWNQIQLTGANSAGTISFDFRWYFL